MKLFKGKNDKNENSKEQEPKKPAARQHPELKVINGSQISRPTPTRQAGMPQQPQQQHLTIPGIKYTIAVASGKGGVGKSTVATNLAIALAQKGARVGLMDADTYGPSIPTMMGVKGQQVQVGPDRKIIPIVKHNITMISIGFMMPEEQAMIARGPILSRYVNEFLSNVSWGELDYLVIDLPPGTGDIQLTLMQTISLTGGLIVTTPQDVALADVRRSAAMFERLNVPILGVIENMSYFVCPHCNEKTNIFRSDGGKRISEKLGVSLLGQIPLDPEVCDAGDAGVPIVSSHPDSPQSEAFINTAKRLAEELENQDEDDALTIIG